MHEGGYHGSAEAEIQAAIDAFDINRPLNHLVKLVAGDVRETAPILVDNPIWWSRSSISM